MNDAEKIEKLKTLLKTYGISSYKITNEHHGHSLTHGPLKKLIIFGRFIPDPREFHELGYGVMHRESEDHDPK